MPSVSGLERNLGWAGKQGIPSEERGTAREWVWKGEECSEGSTASVLIFPCP